MAKKSFKENPALSFISQALSENREEANADIYTDKHTHINADISTDTDMPTAVSAPAHTATQEKVEAAFEDNTWGMAETAPAPEIFADTAPRESKSKRLQLLLRPSTHQGLTALSRTYHTSVNDVINQILEDYLRKVK